MKAIRWYVYPVLFIVMVYTAHFAVDLFIPARTLPEHEELAAKYLAENNLPTPDKPFLRDGCTLWPDKFPKHDFTETCLAHDIAYWAGGSAERQHEANLAFKESVSHTGPLGPALSVIMYLGVEYLGNNGVSRTVGSHWGYGWN